MTESELIRSKKEKLPREEWVKMMQKRKAMQEAGKTKEEIVEALSADS